MNRARVWVPGYLDLSISDRYLSFKLGKNAFADLLLQFSL
jgi:hypothetical protein